MLIKIEKYKPDFHADLKHLDIKVRQDFQLFQYDSYQALVLLDWLEMIGHLYAQFCYRIDQEILKISFDLNFELILSDYVDNWSILIDHLLQLLDMHSDYVYVL